MHVLTHLHSRTRSSPLIDPDLSSPVLSSRPETSRHCSSSSQPSNAEVLAELQSVKALTLANINPTNDRQTRTSDLASRGRHLKRANGRTSKHVQNVTKSTSEDLHLVKARTSELSEDEKEIKNTLQVSPAP
jgi:hypothetical protein